jgi:CheY-like chemotaxis protein
MDSKPKLLIVDDEEINRNYLESFLLTGFDVYTCGNVSNFYRLISVLNFDAILMDVWLRDTKDGIQLTRELKMNPRYSHVPIFILTANNTRKTWGDAMQAGATNLFDKTVDRKTLITEIAKHVKTN